MTRASWSSCRSRSRPRGDHGGPVLRPAALRLPRRRTAGRSCPSGSPSPGPASLNWSRLKTSSACAGNRSPTVCHGDPARRARLVGVIGRLAEIGPVRFPVHPRTRARLIEYGLADRLTAFEEPLAYDDLLNALAHARVVVTDSGGLQEEAAYLGVPAVVLRRSTPRWEGVESGSAVLTGITSDEEATRAVAAAQRLSTPEELARIAALPCPYGDGHTGSRVARLLSDPALAALLALEEPDYTDGSRPWKAA
ncbi:UDP-N-acetylglucosamine 2-epimerase [Actinoplanes sp. NPDC049548]|uniref:UDP-N-acetylglucosamine 2-epimerase n=1 Tax=Actinoplanes sp. NPDC049548 TaxID=3155152 RepID=UPI00343E8E76